MSAKDYYDLLGVGKSASEDEIKSAFRKKAMQFHPDRPGGDAEKFKEINAAYQVLSNPEKRQKYDQFGASFDQAGAGFGGFGGQGFDFGGGGANFDFSNLGDMFGDIFGRASGGGRRQAQGRNIEMDLKLSFIEAAFGAGKSLNIYSNVACGDCGGSGAAKGAKMNPCKECRGSGQVRRVQQTILGAFQTSHTCGACSGEGKTPEAQCKKCRGQGIVKESREIEVRIPAGIDDGEVLRVTGAGEALKGGKSGDLYLAIRIIKDPRFSRAGFDVRSAAEISVARAALGGVLHVETIDGPVELKIPTGTQPGQIFRLKSKGIPFLKRSGRGDHYVEIKVKVPEKLSREQRKFFEDWKE